MTESDKKRLARRLNRLVSDSNKHGYTFIAMAAFRGGDWISALTIQAGDVERMIGMLEVMKSGLVDSSLKSLKKLKRDPEKK